MNATISGSGADAAGVQRSVSFPFFRGGDRRSQSDWADAGDLPLALMGQYTADQVQLLCLSKVLPLRPRATVQNADNQLWARPVLLCISTGIYVADHTAAAENCPWHGPRL